MKDLRTEDGIKKGMLIGYLEAFAFNKNPAVKPMNENDIKSFFTNFSFMVRKAFGDDCDYMNDFSIDSINCYLKINNFPYHVNMYLDEDKNQHEYYILNDTEKSQTMIPESIKILKPHIVTLIGSKKFISEFDKIETKLTLEGNLVFTPSIFRESRDLNDLSEEEHKMYDKIHREKIKMSDEVFVVNPDGYIGPDTLEEKRFADDLKIKVTFLVEGETYESHSEITTKTEYCPHEIIYIERGNKNGDKS